MALDVYDPCPCGSGRKLKFCCQAILSEMERVLEFQQNNQPRMALAALDELVEKDPGNTWVRATRAGLFFEQGDLESAHTELVALVDVEPEHGFGLAMLAMVRLSEQGYHEAGEDIARAFRSCTETRPDMVANLALGVAAWMRLNGHLLASRQHLALALQLAPSAEQQEQIFSRLIQFDGAREIPFPFRSVYPLAEAEAEAEDAFALAGCGCWSAAAERYAQLANERPERAELRYNEGLCRAWSGQPAEAAVALHAAAGLVDDIDVAGDHETLAQLLELAERDDAVAVVNRCFEIESASQLLTLLDDHADFERVDGGQPAADGDPSGLYHLLDRPLVAATAAAELTLETVPRVIGRLMVDDADGETERPALVHVVGRQGEEIEGVEAALRAAAGELVGSAEETDDGEREETLERIPVEFEALYTTWHFAPETPAAVKRDLQRQHVQQFLETTWPQTTLAALGGRSPQDASGDTSLYPALVGAVGVLESHCQQNQLWVDVAELRDGLNLSSPTMGEVESDDQLATSSTMQLLRIAIGTLDDDRLAAVLNRALLVKHSRLLFDVLEEFVGRPELSGQGEDFHGACTGLAELCHMRHDREAALEWLARGREAAGNAADEFERTLQYEMQELILRLEDPADPRVRELLGRIWTVYGSKVPPLREQLEALVEAHGIVPPWAAGEGDLPEGGTVTASGLWTPSESDSTDAANGEDKKLWLPGQE